MDSHVRSERGISDRVSRRRVGRWAALTAVALVAVLALVSITAQPIASSSVTLTVVGDEEAEPIHLSALSYDDAGAAIHATTFEVGDATLAVQMPGLAAELSADSMIPNLTAKSLALTGTSAGGPVTLLAVWGEAETPEIVFVVDAGTKGFQDWGFDGVPGNYLFPRVMVFLAADSGAKSIPVASIPGATLTSFDGLYPGAGTGSLTLTAGLNVAANVDANDLPDDLKSILSSSDSEELLEGSLGNNDFSFLAGGAFSLPTIQLSATLPAFWEGAFPEWLSVGAPTIVVEIPLGGEGLVAATSIVFPMTVDVGGSLLVFDVNAELDMADDSFGFGATLSSPWVAPFGLDWLTLEATTISVAVPGSGAASAEISASANMAGALIEFEIELDGGDGVINASIDSLLTE